MAGGQSGPATMRQVAERAGVAMATVSRAFSDPGKLSPATLSRIERAGAELNYTINLNARALRRKAGRLVLVLLPDIGNPFFSQLLKGMEEAARVHDRAILIGDTGGDDGLRDSYATQLHGRTVEALVLLDGRLPFAARPVARAGLLGGPVIAVSERIVEASVPFVGIDNVQAARDVAERLAALGHRRVAHIAGPPGNVLSQERTCGFLQGAAASGLTVLGSIEGAFSIESGIRAASALLTWPDRPTAVFAANDEMAMGAIHAFKAASLRVPDDISVVGFDDIAFAEIFDPPLTTVRQPRRAMGRAAIELIASWNGVPPVDARAIVLQHAMVERASLGAPPATKARPRRSPARQAHAAKPSVSPQRGDRCQPR